MSEEDNGGWRGDGGVPKRTSTAHIVNAQALPTQALPIQYSHGKIRLPMISAAITTAISKTMVLVSLPDPENETESEK